MGFDRFAVDYFAGRAAAEPLGRTATIARQQIHADPREIASILRQTFPALAARSFTGYAEPLLGELGATDITSYDASDYEDADVVHDMNAPLPAEHHARYDTVIESGSLEHIFDVRTALGNMMSMPAEGGRLLMAVPANNQMGHGFYQFSPELLFRALSPANGYEVDELFVATQSLVPKIYRVTDPAIFGDRVELLTVAPTYIYLQARRTALTTPFAEPLQQSDYSVAWEGAEPVAVDGRGLRERLHGADKVPLRIANAIRFARLQRRFRLHPPGMTKVPSFTTPPR
jgi:hypothetical protein